MQIVVKLNPLSGVNRGTANRVRSSVVWLALGGLVSCQALSPASDSGDREAPAAVTTLSLPAAGWTSFPSEARRLYSGAELADGSVLVCGGLSVAGWPLTCNRLSFDGTSLNQQTFPLPESRTYGTLSLVPPDRVLLAGGKESNSIRVLTARLSSSFPWSDNQAIWGAPEGNSDSPVPRSGHTATRLDSNIVLIGGDAVTRLVSTIDVRSDDGTWSKVDVGSALATRVEHSATLLQRQPGSPARVLILGGYNAAQGGILNTGFIFSLPNTVTPITPMLAGRRLHTATLLDDGSVLVVGGESQAEAYLGTALRYVPDDNGGQWLAAGSIVARKYHAAARLGADVIIAGGVTDGGVIGGTPGIATVFGGTEDALPNANTVQRYNLATNAWSAAPNLHQGRNMFQLFKLDATHLLAVGGGNDYGALASSELLSTSALGQTASIPGLCLSGHMADGVCCDSECGDPCHWCNSPDKPGICTSVSGVTPNQNGCANHLLCSDGACANRCDATKPCEAGYFCNGNGECQATKGLGQSCTLASQCAGGAPCVDGVCCESPCSGSCEACNQPDRPGLCRPLPEGKKPQAGHASCPAAHDSACAAACDGEHGDRCVFPDSNLQCSAAQCTAEGYQAAGHCDGGGTCSGTLASCGKYACDDAKGCLQGCHSDDECSGEGVHCNDGNCTRCNESECNGFRCDSSRDRCQTTCERSADCMGGYYCHPLEHHCILAAHFPASALPACGIGRAPVRSRPALLGLAAVLCAAAVRRKWRTNRSRVRS